MVQIVGCELVHGIIRWLCHSADNRLGATTFEGTSTTTTLTEQDVELLLVLLTRRRSTRACTNHTLLTDCGIRLRKDDPRSLKDIVALIQQQARAAQV